MYKIKVFKSVSILSALVFAATAMMTCGQGKPAEEEYRKVEGMVWSTTYHITYRGPESLADSVLAEFDKVGRAVNVFDENSLVSQVNRQDSTPVNSDFIRVYVMSRKVNKLSDGAFDPTLEPLIRAWGFGQGHKATADTLRIDSLLEAVGIEKTYLTHDALVKKDSRIRFNFSAIAKGYGCDRVAEMFRRNGVKDFLVEIGGEIMAGGKSPSGGKWRVSIDKPVLGAAANMEESEAIVEFTDRGLATSGNYRNYHKENGKIFGHTISAKTGRPVQTDVLSASVVAATAMEADALATAFMAMGSEDSKRLNEQLKLPIMLVLADSTVYCSPEFDALLSE